MNSRTALKIILAIALFGVAFSGTLTYQELFTKTLLACPAPGKAGTVFGYPACVYGFLMFVVLSVVALLGLKKTTNS